MDFGWFFGAPSLAQLRGPPGAFKGGLGQRPQPARRNGAAAGGATLRRRRQGEGHEVTWRPSKAWYPRLVSQDSWGCSGREGFLPKKVVIWKKILKKWVLTHPHLVKLDEKWQ